jgi:tetratricopeptide (TPR) repeat protein
MMPNFQFVLNQQFQQGCFLAQQAVMAEQMSNVPGAIQCYDQAIGLIANTIGMASQSGIPVLDNVFFVYGYCHFNSGRLKAALGWGQYTPMHLMQALQALNQAITINPNFFQYHSAAGVVLVAQGAIPAAVQAFERAVQLNPADAWSQWMISSLYSAQGNVVQANRYYAAAAQVQSNLPPPQVYAFSAPAAASQDSRVHESKHDWFDLINNALKLGNSIAGVFEQASGGMQSSGWNMQGSGGDWPSS